MRALKNGKIITKDNVLTKKILLLDEKIINIIDECELNNYPNVQVEDVEGKYISPGFIDIHIHGCGGSDTMDADLKSLEIISTTLARNGVTAFLPTTMTMDKLSIYNAFNAVREAINKNIKGSKILGVHMEGPFISEKYKGAQASKYIQKPEFEFIKDYLDIIKIITLAPEEDDNYEFIKKVKKDSEIVLSIGHSDATYNEAMNAIETGVSHSTHTFNAMTPLNHRKPGIVGAALTSNISSEIIADKVHVHPALFQIFVDLKSKEKVILITDSMRAGCMKNGEYELGGQKVIVQDNAARLSNGVLAGSILTLNQAVKNFFENTNLNINEAVNLASLNPAKVIKIDNKKGSIERGKDADIIIFDNDFNIYETIVEGKTIFLL